MPRPGLHGAEREEGRTKVIEQLVLDQRGQLLCSFGLVECVARRVAFVEASTP
jgi:hypothetical protein